MVRSYAAYVPKDDLVSLYSLAALFDRLPDTVIKLSATIEPLELPEGPASAISTFVPGLVSVAVQLGSTEPLLPLVWASALPYVPTIDALWMRLPHSLRPAFSFAFQFAPEHRFPTPVTLVATLPALAGRWPAEQILSVDAQPKKKLTATQGWLAGTSEGTAFNRILVDHGIKFRKFGDLNLLSAFADLADRLNDLTFAEARRAVRILEKFASVDSLGSVGRTALFAKLCSLTGHATFEDISTLRNFDPTVVNDLIGPLQAAIGERLIHEYQISKSLLSNFELAADTSNSWWSKPFIARLYEVAGLSVTGDAKIVCELLTSEKLSSILEPRLPSDQSAENKLIESLPGRIDERCATKLLHLSKKRDWMRLHAICLARSRPSKEAIKAYVEMAGASSDGLDLLQKELGFFDLLQSATLLGEAKLVQYTGRNLSKHLELEHVSEKSVTDSPNWSLIQAHAVSLLEGELIGSLRSSVVATLQNPLIASDSKVALASACNTKDITIWMDVNNPGAIIDVLSSQSKLETATKLNAYLAEKIQAAEPLKVADLEGFRQLVDVDNLLHALGTATPQLVCKAGANAFRCFPFLSDDHCCSWLVDLFTRTQHFRLNGADVDEIVSILLASNYPEAAKIIRDTVERYTRDDVAPILDAIRSKYGLIEHPKPQMTVKQTRLAKIVIATALPLERTEVMAYLENSTYDWQLFADVAMWPADKPMFEIYVLATGAGNLEAQGAMLRLLAQVKPRLAFFIGVAGGMKDSEVGDVIYSTKVYYYEGGKEADDEFKSRPSTEHTNEALVQLALRVAERDWQPKNQLEEMAKPKASPAVVASGDKVLAGTSSEASTFQLIKRSYNDTQVVDMEAYGFLKSLRAEGIRYSMVIRGVSDKIVGKADSDAKGSQPVAARNAAAFLFALLGAMPELFASKKGKKKGLANILSIFKRS